MAFGDSNASATVEDSTVVQSSASELVSKHKGRGRPKGSTNRPKQETASETKAQAPVDDATREANLGLVKKTVESTLAAIDGLVVRKVSHHAERLGAPPDVVQEYRTTVGMSTDEQNVVAECSATIVARHDFLLRYAPEVALGCVLASYGIRVATVMKRLDYMEAKLRAQQTAATANPAMIRKPDGLA